MKLLYSVIFVLLSLCVYTQNNYWISFKNKKDTSFDPYEYFDAKAIERRVKYNIPLNDSTDYPLNRDYVNTVGGHVNELIAEIRWFNMVAVSASEEQIEKICAMDFVKSVELITTDAVLTGSEYGLELTAYHEKMLENQISSMQGFAFVDNELTGKGMRVAVFDGGFPSVDTSPVFEHIRKRNGIVKTYDFTKKKEFVYGYISHGTNVLSCIAGMVDGKNIGLATDAEFLLARTEISREPFKEEIYWLEAVEWADKNGADIINSSLGYTHHRYFYEDMDGKTTYVTKAGNMAAAKGILVVNSAGNEGSGKWKHIGAPADADSVLSIGGIHPDTYYHTSFSSYGPTADKRLKPNVCAFGHVVAAGKNKLHTTQGTSFSSPLVAGFAACAWQSKRDLSNMEMFEEIQKSGSLYPYFDYAHGYGIPQATYFTDKESVERKSTIEYLLDGDYLVIKINEELISENETNYLYYHIEDLDGILDYYVVIDVYQEEVAKIYLPDIEDDKTIRTHYKGYTEEYKLTK